MSSASENLRHSVREHLAKVQRGVLGLPDSPAIKLDAIKQARGLDKTVQVVSEPEEGYSRVRILKVIETLRKHGAAVTSIAVAAELGVPAQMLYQDRDLLDAIYSAAQSSNDYHDLALLQGADALIAKLLKDNKSLKRKNTKLSEDLEQASAEIKKTFADAFAQGAAMRYGEASVVDHQLHLEKWARGVLFLEQNESLDTDKIKKAYRRLLTIVHPDQSLRDTGSLMNSLQSAYRFLLERYQA